MPAKGSLVTGHRGVPWFLLPGIKRPHHRRLIGRAKDDLARPAQLVVLHEDALFFDLPVDLGCCLRRFDNACLRQLATGRGDVLALPESAASPDLRPGANVKIKVGVAGISPACGRPAGV